jgi:hypothetical protein
VLAGHLAQHLFPQLLLAHREGRCREIHDGLRACLRQRFDGVLMVTPALPEIPVVPDVLTDADAQAESVQLQDSRRAPRLEVAIFVENVIGRQQALVKHRSRASVIQQDRAVE